MRCELVKTADIVAALTECGVVAARRGRDDGDVGKFSGARRPVEALSPAGAQVDVRIIPA